MKVWLFGSLVVALSVACVCGPGVSAPPPKAKEDDAEVKKLLKQRRDSLKESAAALRQQFEAGQIKHDGLLTVGRELLEAELEVVTTLAERIAAHTEYFKVACESDERYIMLYRAGRATRADQLQARAERHRAEVGLRRAGGKPPADTKAPIDP